jgi:hypothetical protein
MRLTNAPTNALRRMTNAHADARTNAPTNDANALCTRPPIPPYAFAPRARLQAPPFPPAFGHGCAIAALASKRSDHPQDEQPDELQKGGIVLILPILTRILWSPFLAGVSRCLPGSAARVIHAFARSGCTNTAVRSTTHQRTRHGLRQPILPTQCPHGWPANSVRPAIAAFRTIDHMIDDHGKGVFARVAAASFTLVDGKTRSRNLDLGRYLRDRPSEDPAWGCRGPLPGCLGIIDVPSEHTAAISPAGEVQCIAFEAACR